MSFKFYYYPAKFEKDEAGGFVVTFRDVPEAITQGDDFSEAVSMAVDALITASEFYKERNEKMPIPTTCDTGEVLIPFEILD